MEIKETKNSIPDLLNKVSYEEDPTYVPSRFALEFVNFIKLVNGSDGEENKTPVLHYRILDQIAGKDTRIANLLFRGAAKSTIFGEYLILYLATFGGILPNFGKIELALYISDSIDNGIKNMRKNIEYRWGNSEFLQHYVPEAKFTDIEWRFKNKDDDIFIVKGYGAKALSLDTVLYTERGKTTIRDCKVGQRIYGADGKLTTIVAKSDYFTNAMYKLIFDDGRTLKVNEDHINPVLIYKQGWFEKKARNLTTKELIQFSKNKNGNEFNMENIWVKSIEAIQYPEKSLPLDPYVYGLALVTGKLHRRHGLRITLDNIDAGIAEKLNPLLTEDVYPARGKTDVTIMNSRTLTDGLRLENTALNRSVMKPYFTASVEQRLELVRGLMDGQGELVSEGRLCRFKTCSGQLRDDMVALVRSLGGWCKGNICTTERGKRYYICYFTLPYSAFHRNDLQEKQKIRKRDPALVCVRRIANERSQCIAVDNQEKHFIAGEYLRTHNTGIRGTKAMGKRPKLAILDDLISDEDARSATELSNIKDTVYKAVNYALHPTLNKIIWCGTPFNAKDPLYEAVESGAWAVNVYPVCEKFPCSRKEFRGAWEDRFTYDFVKAQYDKALKEGMVSSFNQELMLRIMSDDERLLEESCFRWYNKNSLLKNKQDYNWYITTDFATTEKQSGDFSVISVWAYNSNGDWFWVDGIAKKQTMDKNIDDLFRLVSKYHPVSEVGIEVTGQQAGFIPWIQNEMMQRNIWFTLASKDNSNAPGIRPNTNKMQRFNVVVPWFKAGKMYFPVGHEYDEALQEMLEELRLASAAGFKSKHDDAIDTISMLASLKTFKPNNETALMRNAGDVYEDAHEEDDFSSSYFV